MFAQLTESGYGIILFAILIGVGTVVLFNFGNGVGVCSADKTINSTTGLCTNATATATPTGTAYTNVAYLMTQLGSGGLSGWVPAIIAIVIGLLFLSAFGFGRKSKGKY